MEEIKKEIEKIIFSETPCKSSKQEKIRKVEELVKLFKSYAHSLKGRQKSTATKCSETTYNFIRRR